MDLVKFVQFKSLNLQLTIEIGIGMDRFNVFSNYFSIFLILNQVFQEMRVFTFNAWKMM